MFIDIRNERPDTNVEGIQFWDKTNRDGVLVASKIYTKENQRYQRAYICDSSAVVLIDSNAHARKLIEALELGISRGFFE